MTRAVFSVLQNSLSRIRTPANMPVSCTYVLKVSSCMSCRRAALSENRVALQSWQNGAKPGEPSFLAVDSSGRVFLFLFFGQQDLATEAKLFGRRRHLHLACALTSFYLEASTANESTALLVQDEPFVGISSKVPRGLPSCSNRKLPQDGAHLPASQNCERVDSYWCVILFAQTQPETHVLLRTGLDQWSQFRPHNSQCVPATGRRAESRATSCWSKKADTVGVASTSRTPDIPRTSSPCSLTMPALQIATQDDRLTEQRRA